MDPDRASPGRLVRHRSRGGAAPVVLAFTMICLFLAFVSWYIWDEYYRFDICTIVSPPTGLPPEPYQVPVTGLQPLRFGRFLITPVCAFSETGLVVATDAYEGYFFADALTEACPVDVAVIWGELAGPGIRDRIRAEPSHERWVSVRVEDPPPEIRPLLRNLGRCLGNNHLVIADPVVGYAARRIRPGDDVTLTGYLVNISFSNGRGDTVTIATSTRRDDEFLGACEIILPVSIRLANRLYQGRDPFIGKY